MSYKKISTAWTVIVPCLGFLFSIAATGIQIDRTNAELAKLESRLDVLKESVPVNWSEMEPVPLHIEVLTLRNIQLDAGERTSWIQLPQDVNQSRLSILVNSVITPFTICGTSHSDSSACEEQFVYASRYFNTDQGWGNSWVSPNGDFTHVSVVMDEHHDGDVRLVVGLRPPETPCETPCG